MSNPFDQFDAATPQGDSNPFDQFDAGKKKDSRSAVGEIANQFKAGILVDLPKMAGQALKYTSDPGNKVYEAGQGITDWADEQGKRPDLAPQEDQHNIVTNALASGARMIPQSVAPAAAVGAGILALPASIPATVGLGAASVLGAVPAAMSQGQETLEKAREKGIPEDQALAAARSNALIEGGGEALGTYAGGKLLGIAGKTVGKMFGRTAGDALADQTSTAITKPFLKQLGETALVETGTEIGQNAGEAAVENAYGIDSKTPYQAGKEAIAPTLGMTALLAPFGLAGFAHAGKKRGERTDALSSADTSPEDRQKIAGEFAAEIGKVDEQAAANFMANAQYAIDGKQALSIGESMFLPPVAAEETPAPLALPAPTYTGTPGDQVMAAEVERQNQVDAAQKKSDALYAERAAFEQANAPETGYVAPVIPVVGPLSAAANLAVQSGAHAATVAQQQAAIENSQAEASSTQPGKADTPTTGNREAAPQAGILAGIAAQAPSVAPTAPNTQPQGQGGMPATAQQALLIEQWGDKPANQNTVKNETPSAASDSADSDSPEQAPIKNKEPWQMTRDEFEASGLRSKWESVYPAAGKLLHDAIVAEAQKRGLSVPLHVRKQSALGRVEDSELSEQEYVDAVKAEKLSRQNTYWQQHDDDMARAKHREIMAATVNAEKEAKPEVDAEQLRKATNQNQIKNEAPAAATVSEETTVPKQEPIKNQSGESTEMVNPVSQPKTDAAPEAKQDKAPVSTPQPDAALQNRDRGRAASVNQMQSIARNPDYMRLGPSRTPDSGAPMVFAVGGDTNKIQASSFGANDIAVMSDGQRVPFRYAVVDASSVEPSNFADGAANPAFASMAPGTIKALNNGRTAGVRAAHEGRKAANYTAELLADQAHGVSPEAIRSTPNPMLVRVYAEQANTGDMAAKSQGQGLGMSASERATQDAELMTSEVLDKFAPGDIASAGNRDFVRAFVGKLAENELADMMDATGNLSQDGRRRIEAALLTAAYGKSDLVQELFESTDTDIKAIGNALKVMSGQWASMRNAAKDGVIDPDTDMTANLIEAVNIVRRSRAEGSSIAELAGQGDLMGGNYLNELSELFLRIFYKGKNYDRARGGDKVIAALQEIVTSAMNTKAEAGLFGDSFKATPKQIVESARSKIDEENKPASQSSLFGANGQATAVSQGNRSEGAAKSGEVGQRPVGTGRSEETGKQAEPVERSISDLQKELESAKFGERTELNGILIERVSEDAERSIKQGEMPMYQTGQGTFVALHPSAQQDGMIQATRYSDTGVFGDSQYKEVKEAVRDNGLWFKRRLPDAEAARLLEQSIAAEAEYQKRKNGASEPVAKAAEQSPAVDSKQSNDADLESRILIAADSIDKLRKVDVERVLMQGNIDRKQMADYIKRKRPEFSAEVDSVIEDATVEDNQKSEALDREMAGFTGVNDAEYELRQLSPKENREYAKQVDNNSQRNFRNIDALNPLTAPVEDGNWFNIGGKDWQARNGYTGRGWALIDADKKTHPTINNIDANADLIREIVQANESAKSGDSNPTVAAEKPAESKAASATADAGEELTYNKRNRRAGGVKWDDIKDKNTALRVKEVVKAKVYPKPDYQALVDGGMKDVVAHIVKQAYDAIAPKPKLSRGAEASDEALQTYITAVNRVMDGVMKWASDDAAVAKWAAKQSKLAGGSINISELAAASTLLDTVYPNGWKANRDELIMLGGNKLLGALQPGYDEVGRAMRDIKLGWPASVESWQKQGMKVVHVDTLTVDLYASPARPNRAAYVSGMLSVGKQRIDTFVINGTDNKEDQVVQEVVADRKRELEGKYVLLDKSGRPLGVFDGEDSAAEAAREKAKKETGEKISEKGVSVEMAERVGIDHRLPGDDVTSERLKETFGFRGVNFGNWMQGDTKAKVAERQLHLNHLYDAFMDLAQLLNLPPKAMSLNGMLGIAVGAQGSGKALAHFVPGVNEINVTRTKGAGALAHEWGHALDHYFATMGGLDRKAEPYLSAHVGTLDGRVVDGKYVRSPVALAEVRPEVAEQFQSIVEAMTKRHETKEEYESRLKSEKSIAGRLVADEISKITKDIEAAKTGWGTPELVAKVRGLAERVAALDFGDGRVSVAGGEVPAVIAEIADAYLQASGAPLPNAYALGYHADRYKVIAELLESAEKWEPRTVTTDYQKASDQADGKTRKYWATKLEMFARAFDAYVVDSLAEKEEKNSYLSGIEAVAPQGDERKAIGKAFDFLFAELKTKETERGTAIYNITGKTDSLSPADTAIYGMASDGKSAAEILKFIASASRNPFYRQLAKLLQKTGIAPSVTVGDGKGWKMNAGEGHKYAAAYNPKMDAVSLFRPASAERHVLHELMHAATLKALAKNGLASAQMKSLFAHIKKSGALKGMYGMSDIDEFVAEAFSNPKFQDMLKKVAAPTATGGKLSSAWDWFVRVVRGILGIPQGQENALSQAIALGLGVMRENMKLSDTGGDTRYALSGDKRKPKQTDSEAFRKWFGSSVVVNADGQPLLVYHGTGATDINDFKVSDRGTYGGGIYLTPDIRGANDYAIYRGAPSSTVYPVYAAIKNPASGSEAAQVASWKGEENAREELIRRGYDGVVDVRSGEIVAFYPSQVKSAIGNSGDFDASNPDIRYNVADEGWSVSEPSKMDDLIYAMQDKQIDMRRVVQSIMRTGKKVKDEVNAYLQEELFHGRAAKGVKDFLDFELRPLLKQMQEAKVDMGDFEEYLWNRHAEERNKQIAKINPDMPDGGSGIETAKARAYLAGLSAEQRKTFEALAAKVETMNRESQRVLVESGLEKQSTIDAWNGAYQHYVPLQREDVDSGHVGTGKGFSVRGSSSKRAMGSGKKVVDIIANLTMQRERNIVRAEKNRVSNALLGLAVQNPNPDFWKVDQAPKERVVQEKAIYTVLDSAGNKIEEFTRMDDAERLANKTPGASIDQTWGDRVTERVTPGFTSRDNVLLTRINGEDHYVIFNERDERAMRMATAMKNLDMDNLGRVLSVVGKATRYLSAINTQYNPIFGVINLVRDTQGALINLSSTPLAGEQKRVLGYTKDALVGIYKDIRAHRAGNKPSSNWAALFEEFQKEGGQTGYRDQYANAEARAEAIQKELEQFKEGKAKQLARGLFGWLSDYNETMENAVRLAAYKAAKEKGMSKQQAASLAKNITVNFNRKGQMATQVGSLYAFFNASVQGTARIAGTLFDMKDGDIRTARLSSTGKKIVYGGIMLGSMQALLLAAAGFGDDEPPDFIKERNLILPIGDGKYLTLAMPLGYHVFPGIGRLATEFVLSGGKDPLKKIAAFGSMFAEALNPIGNSGFSLQTITPSVIDPLAALAENRDFTGKEIYQNDFNKLNPTPGFTRAKDTATAWSKAIAEGLNFITGGTDYKPGLFTPTPDQIDYLIGQVTGGVGREVGKVSQVVSATTTGEDLPIYKVPLVGRFVGDTQGKSGESAKFYNSLREINMHEAEYKGLIGDGKRQEAAEYLAENPAVKLIMLGNQSERAVKKLKEAKRNLIENDAPQEKVAAMEDQIAKSMKLFNDRVTKALAQ